MCLAERTLSGDCYDFFVLFPPYAEYFRQIVHVDMEKIATMYALTNMHSINLPNFLQILDNIVSSKILSMLQPLV